MTQASQTSVWVSLDGDTIYMDSFTQTVGIINEVDSSMISEGHTKEFSGVKAWVFQPEIDAACGNYGDQSSYQRWHLGNG